MNLTDYVNPGIYQITCLKLNKKYIGESQNVLERLGKHVAMLNQSVHDSIPLQTDWNQFGKTQFQIDVLFIGPEWENRDKRTKKETELINQLPICERYNNSDSNLIYRQIILLKNNRFDSIAQAARALEVSETTVRRRLNSSKYPNYSREKVQIGSSISIQGVIYPSLKKVIEIGLATNRYQAYRRLNSKSDKWRDWFYVNEKRQV